jgi:hypothetical protein
MPWTNPETFTAGQTLTAASMNIVSGNLNALTGARRLGYQTQASNYTVNQTALASATDMFSSDITFTADGTSTYMVEFYSGRVISPNAVSAFSWLVMTDGGSNALGTMAIMFNNATTGFQLPCHVKVPYTPAAGSRTINARAVYSGTTGMVFYGGSGGSSLGDMMPMWMAVYGPETTNP